MNDDQNRPVSVRFKKKDENHVKLKIFGGIVISIILALLVILFIRNIMPKINPDNRDWIAQVLYSDEDIDPYFNRGVGYDDLRGTDFDPNRPNNWWVKYNGGVLDLSKLVLISYNNGNETLTIVKAKGDSLAQSELKLGHKEGYSFVGWYSGGSPYKFGEPINSNIFINSKWKLISDNTGGNDPNCQGENCNNPVDPSDPTTKYWTVTFMVGSNIIEQQEIKDGQFATMATPPEIAGSTFLGWYNGNTLYVWETPVHKNLTLKAHYRQDENINYREQYTVNFKLDGDANNCYVSRPFKGQRVNNPPQNYCNTRRAGYTFSGWFEGNNKFSFLTQIMRDYSLLGKFKQGGGNGGGGDVIDPQNPVTKTYNIYYNDGKTMKTIKKQEGSTLSPNELTFAYAGNSKYRLTGWKDSRTGEDYDFSQQIFENKYITAKYTYDNNINTNPINDDGAARYKIEFYVNDKLMGTQTVIDGDRIPEHNYNFEGYTFDGWYDESGNRFDFNTIPRQSMKLYATSVINKYTVTFRDGDTTVRTQEIEYNGKASFFEPDYDAEYFKFEGWYNGNTKWNFSNNIKQSTTLEAKYSSIAYQYDINWNPKYPVTDLSITGKISYPVNGDQSKVKVSGDITKGPNVAKIINVYTYTNVGTVNRKIDNNITNDGSSIELVTELSKYKPSKDKLYYGATVVTNDGKIIDSIRGNLLNTRVTNTATQLTNDRTRYNKAETKADNNQYKTEFSITNRDNQYKELIVSVYEKIDDNNRVKKGETTIKLIPGSTVEDSIKFGTIDDKEHNFEIEYIVKDLGYTVNLNEDYHQIRVDADRVCTECTRDRIELKSMWSRPIDGNKIEVHMDIQNTLTETIQLSSIYDINETSNNRSLNTKLARNDSTGEYVFVMNKNINSEFVLQFKQGQQIYDTHIGPLYTVDLSQIKNAMPSGITVKNYVYTAPDANGKQTLILYFDNEAEGRTVIEVDPYPQDEDLYGTQTVVTEPGTDFSMSFYGMKESDIKRLVPNGDNRVLIDDIGILTYNPQQHYVSKFNARNLKAEIDYDGQKIKFSGDIKTNLDETVFRKLYISCEDELGGRTSYTIEDNQYRTQNGTYSFERTSAYAQHSAVCKLVVEWDDQVSDKIEKSDLAENRYVKQYKYKAPTFENTGNHRTNPADIKISGGINKITVPQYDTGKQEITFDITNNTTAYQYVIIDHIWVDNQDILEEKTTLAKGQSIHIFTDIGTMDNHDTLIQYHTSEEYKLTQVGDWWPGVISDTKLIQCDESDIGLCFETKFTNTAKFNSYDFSTIGYFAVPKTTEEQDEIMENYVNVSRYSGIPAYKSLDDNIRLAKNQSKTYVIPIEDGYYVYNFDNIPSKIEDATENEAYSAYFNDFAEGSHMIASGLEISDFKLLEYQNNAADGKTGTIDLQFNLVNNTGTTLLIDSFSLYSGRGYIDLSKNAINTGNKSKLLVNDDMLKIDKDAQMDIVLRIKRGQKDYSTINDLEGTNPEYDNYDVLANLRRIYETSGKISIRPNTVYVLDRAKLNDKENGTYKLGDDTYYKINSNYDLVTLKKDSFTLTGKVLSYGGNSYIYGIEGAYSSPSAEGRSKLGWYTLKYNTTTLVNNEVSTYRPAEINIGPSSNVNLSNLNLSGVSRVE